VIKNSYNAQSLSLLYITLYTLNPL